MNERRGSVLDCGSPLPLCVARVALEKRQRADALQNLAESSIQLSRRGGNKKVKPLISANTTPKISRERTQGTQNGNGIFVISAFFCG
jgi:hypothetical protein